MSVEFRQRRLGEYVAILWNRRWLIVLPTVAVSLAVAWVVWNLPNVYESQTLLTVRPATISSKVVTQLSDSDLSMRINNIGQEVVSRTSLEPIILKHNLYAEDRARGEPMDELVEYMKADDITITINKSRDDVTNGFNISFRAPAPETAKAVAAELAGKYVNAQTKFATEGARATNDFFEARLNQARADLDDIDRRRLEVMVKNRDNLPSASGPLVERLTGLYDQQKTYVTEIGRKREQITTQNNLLGVSAKQKSQEIVEAVNYIADPKSSHAYAELMKSRAAHESELQKLLGVYKEKHPDVISKKSEVAAVQRQMDELVADHKRKVAERREMLESRVDTGETTYRSNIRELENEIKLQQKQLALVESQISEVTQRINAVPNAEVALGTLDREYLSKKSVFEDLLKQQQQASITADATMNAQGETIAVIDPANLPEQPVAPKRPVLFVLGLVLGLCTGLTLAAAREVPRLLTVQSSEDAEHYTGLPVLVSVPELLTANEERRRKTRRAALAFAAVAATIVSVPALALALKLTRIIEMVAMRG